MDADTNIEIYEESWSKEPNSNNCITAMKMSRDGYAPAVGDHISIILGGGAPRDYRVTARTHLAGNARGGEAEWMKMWVFVEKI